MKNGMTISEAAHKWVSEFNAIPGAMIEQLMKDHFEEWEEVTVLPEDDEDRYDDWLPMWGTMWSFGDSCDDWWLEEENGIKIMSECGFRIYSHEEYGYFFGIDGAGYDFYSEHWIPLYRKRGLQWHDTNVEGRANKDEIKRGWNT